MNERQFQFEWDENKPTANLRKHGVSFEDASTIFNDPQLLTVAGLEHSATVDRWFSVGFASSGAMLAAAYPWSESDLTTTKIRLGSARKATRAQIRQYHEESP